MIAFCRWNKSFFRIISKELLSIRNNKTINLERQQYAAVFGLMEQSMEAVQSADLRRLDWLVLRAVD